MNLKDLQLKSIEYRKTILEIIYNGKAGHTAGSPSCIDILNVLYNRVLNINPQNFNNTDRNRYIQSKGHSVEALYTVLCDNGFFPKSDLYTLNKFTMVLCCSYHKKNRISPKNTYKIETSCCNNLKE